MKKENEICARAQIVDPTPITAFNGVPIIPIEIDDTAVVDYSDLDIGELLDGTRISNDSDTNNNKT